MTNGNDSAFPESFEKGLTKREYFAAMALQGLLANTNNGWSPGHVKDAVSFADDLIKALNETP